MGARRRGLTHLLCHGVQDRLQPLAVPAPRGVEVNQCGVPATCERKHLCARRGLRPPSPRDMVATIPDPDTTSKSRGDGAISLSTVKPAWNPSKGTYEMNFFGRVTQASDPEHVIVVAWPARERLDRRRLD